MSNAQRDADRRESPLEQWERETRELMDRLGKQIDQIRFSGTTEQGIAYTREWDLNREAGQRLVTDPAGSTFDAIKLATEAVAATVTKAFEDGERSVLNRVSEPPSPREPRDLEEIGVKYQSADELGLTAKSGGSPDGGKDPRNAVIEAAREVSNAIGFVYYSSNAEDAGDEGPHIERLAEAEDRLRLALYELDRLASAKTSGAAGDAGTTTTAKPDATTTPARGPEEAGPERVIAAAEALADAIGREERTDEEQEEIYRAVRAWRALAKAKDR